MIKKGPLFILFLFLLIDSVAQSSKIQVYASFKEKDSVYKAVQLLFDELTKAGNFNYELSNNSVFDNKGILILKTQQAKQFKVILPTSLQSMGPEGIYIKAEPQFLIIAGNTGLALQEAVYLYLEQLGFRWLMPGNDWNIVPKLTSPYIKFTILTQPHYDYRFISNAHGYINSEKIANDFDSWAQANNMGGSFSVRIGHAYESIVQRNVDLFKQHPEYFANPPAKGTLPDIFKFNVANKDLIALVVKDAVERYELQQSRKDLTQMISMEPSDGGGFCKTKSCLEIGSPSDQAFYLTNTVARTFQKKYPGVWVGSYAYNEHILPPKSKVEPNVFVMITNGFNNSKYSTTELMDIWKKRVTKIGVYEYLSVYEWDLDLPGQPAAGDLKYLQSSVKNYYEHGVRAYQGESVMGWVNRGPGQYLLSKLLWNINVNADSIMRDFFEKGYENTAPLISKLYSSWQNYKHKQLLDNDMADWLKLVNDAYNLAKTDKVRNRINYLKMYLNYLVMYRDLKAGSSEQKINRILNYAYRTFEQTAFATLPAMVSLPSRAGYPGLGWYDNPNQSWKQDKRPYSNAELEETFQQALRSIKKVEGVSPFPYTNQFIKLSDITKYSGGLPKLTRGHAVYDKTEYIIRINKKGEHNFIEMHSGFSSAPPIDKDVEIRIYALKKENEDVEKKKPVLTIQQNKKDIVEKFSLGSLGPGTYKLIIDDRRKMFVLKFSNDIDYSIVIKPDYTINTTSSAGLNYFWFYVPKGVKKFQVTKTVVLLLISPTGREIDKQNNLDETFFVDVLPGEEGIWRIGQQAGSIYLEGVPPYIGDHPTNMLVPAYLKK